MLIVATQEIVMIFYRLEIAQKGNAIIVPIAAEQSGKHFKINIGKNFDMQVYASDTTGIQHTIPTHCPLLLHVLAVSHFPIFPI